MPFDVFLDLLLSAPVLGLLGLLIGSFLNVVIHRLPQMMERDWRRESAELLELPAPDEGPPLSLLRPGSRCPHCGHALRWHENLPLIGWLRLRGRCAACRSPISPRYPLVEGLTGLLFAGLAWRFGADPVLLAWAGFVAVLIAAAGIDWDTTLLPDSLTQPLLWAGLIAAALGWTLPLDQALWGAVAGYGVLWTVFWLFKLLTGKDGMGAGDFKLLAALGAWLGPAMLLPVLLAASLIGAAVGLGLKSAGHLREGRYVPFGPFLAGAGLLVLYAGPARVSAWMGWA
ncbi:prepilin peptidase [Piscinibacter sp. Jin2]|uniref:Prepilin leader peptidase/N-methyltransferase n=1 Tax=Aquariibacter lacus TaxID=2801332 RepID=A0A9X0XBJ1_9BURK|nr:A24 family peptidase [Piscinibacter lacus]MBL0719157.1 prepilin peptidase [Piscinibacter lacus]